MSILFDHSRPERIGLPETVYCQGKTVDAVASLMREHASPLASPLLFTRLAKDMFEAIPEEVRKLADYHELSRTAWTGVLPEVKRGSAALVSAGTSDGPVLWEAARTLEYLGIRRTVFEDSGVAGLWRLAGRLDEINAHDAIIIVAGMDAALASVLGGLTPKPVIAVPTSVGYGAAEGGKAALLSMLASCAPGVAVMNIDNGYGAACAAARILRLLNG